MKEELDINSLQKLWQSQEILGQDGFNNHVSLNDELKKLRYRILRSNIIATSCSMVAFVVIGYTLYTYDQKNTIFIWTILSILAIITIVGVIIWMRLPSKNSINHFDTSAFVTQQIKILKRTKLMIRSSPFYGLLLGLILNLYYTSLTTDWEFIFYMANATWVYILIVTVFTYRYKLNKYNREVQPIIDELEIILKNLD